MSFTGFVEGDVRSVRMSFWRERYGFGRPSNQVCFIGREIQKTYDTVWESLYSIPRCTTPDLYTLKMECRKVCSKGSPGERGFRPILMSVRRARGTYCSIFDYFWSLLLSVIAYAQLVVTKEKKLVAGLRIF